MARVAIILGVSNYARQQALPACNNDAELIRHTLLTSQEYEDILFLAGTNTNSDEVKHQLTQFVEKHKAREDLKEVFFFYSGHGQFLDDEFYFILSDFDESRRNRTSLKNSELDGYLRTLGPDLAVKIVDACNAGVQYVKDASGIAAIIEKGSKEQGLKKVYFLFSSLLDQSSFAGPAISDYTRSLLEAIYSHSRPDVRYRDIVDQITDQFENKKDQRPFFVIQADNTEIFGSFTDQQKNEIRARLEAITTTPTKDTAGTATPTKLPALGDLIKEKAKDYLNDEEIINSIEQLPIAANKYSLPNDIADLFKITIDKAKDFIGLSNLAEIGKWLKENDKEYFARVVSMVEEYEGYENALSHLLDIGKYADFIGEPKGKKIKKTRTVISGYQPMWDEPSFWRLGVTLNSNYPNVPTYKLNILYLFSRLDIRLFYSIDEKWSAPGHVTTRTVHGSWKAIQLRLRILRTEPKAIDDIFNDFTYSVIEKLKQIAGIPKEQPSDGGDDSAKPAKPA